MRINEVMDREILTEMAFTRRAIRAKTEALQVRIVEHTVKVLCIPSGALRHWRRELAAWGNYLAGLKLAQKGNPPMGAAFAYGILYKEPFEPDHLRMTVAFIEMVAAEYDIDLDPDVAVVHEKLRAFLRDFAEKIGTGQPVNDVVEALQPIQ